MLKKWIEFMIFGSISYLNLLPFQIFLKRCLNHSGAKMAFRYYRGVPSSINKALKSRRVNAAFISSIASKKCKCSNLGIIAKGSVYSVFVIPNKNGDDPDSQTSNYLAKILGLKGQVIIGDKALKYYLDGGVGIDLAKEWNERYKLPFVFALLCYHKDEKLYKSIHKEFLKQKVKIPQYILNDASKRTGIKTRHIAEGEVTSDLAYKAALDALNNAKMLPEDIDMIIVATITPDYFTMPSTACVVAEKLGIVRPAVDISAACTGFIYALAHAKAFIESEMYKNVLIIGAETLSKIVNWKDRTTCVLFGDGAGAAIISATEEKQEAIIDIDINADGKYQDYLITPGRGVKYGCDTDRIWLEMKGNETFKVAVKTLSKSVRDILKRNNMTSDDLTWFVPHQANYRIIKAVGDALKLEPEQVVLTVAKYGNTSGASIPMAINDIYESGRLKKGEMMLLDTFGGGLTWASALLPFAGEAL